MATTYKELTRQHKSLPQGGGIFQEKITFTGTDSIVYRLPVQRVEGISVMTGGVAGAVVEATNENWEDVQAGTALWSTWDGTSQFSNGVTSLRLSGAVGSIISLAVRTEKA